MATGWKAWMGLYRGPDHEWKWITGEPLSFTDWHRDPSAPGNDRGALGQGISFKWAARERTSLAMYICEWELVKTASDTKTPNFSKKTLGVLQGRAICARFSTDGRMVAAGGGDGVITVWEVPSGKLHCSLSGHIGPVKFLAFHPSQPVLASASYDKTVRLWDTTKGTPLKTLPPHPREIDCVAFSPGGKFVATGSKDVVLRIWRWPKGEHVKDLLGHEAGVHSLAFSPDGEVLASGARDGIIRVWKTGTWESIRSFPAHNKRSVDSLEFNANISGRVKRSPGAAQEWKEKFVAGDPVAYAHTVRAMLSSDLNSERLADIDVPTLVLAGDEDSALEAARFTHSRVAGSQLVVIADAGHFSNVDQPEKFNQSVLEFLQRVEAPVKA